MHSDKSLHHKVRAHIAKKAGKARHARQYQRSTPTERAVAQEQISAYLARVPKPPVYLD